MNTKRAVHIALKAIGKQGFDGHRVIAATPVLALQTILRTHHVPAAQYSTVMRELRRQKLADFRRDGNKVVITLTPAGAMRLQQLHIDELHIKKPANWDKKWRFVTFDIPVEQSKHRVKLTRQLQRLGFSLLQRSLWVHPYPCFPEVEKIASHLNLMRYCTLFEANRFDAQTETALQKIYERFQ